MLRSLREKFTGILTNRKQHKQDIRIQELFQNYSNGSFEVRRSLIPHPDAGAGLFTKKSFKAGDIIGQYEGKLIPTMRDIDDTIKDKTYMLYVFNDESAVLKFGINGTNEFKFANSSEDPNMEAFKQGDKVFFRALKDIPEGAELTHTYMAQHVAKQKPHYNKMLGVFYSESALRRLSHE
jgi:SET domain-containing protein